MAANKYLDEFDPIKVKQEDGSVVSGIFKAYHDGQSEVQLCHDADAGEEPNPVIFVDNENIEVYNCG